MQNIEYEGPVPATMRAWAERHADKVEMVTYEDDGWGDTYAESCRPSYWVYLRPGWINAPQEVHSIHEKSLRAVAEAFRWVEACACETCTH